MEENNSNSAEQKSEKKLKINKKVSLIVIIILFVLIGISLFIYFSKDRWYTPKPDSIEQPIKEEKTEEQKEDEIEENITMKEENLYAPFIKKYLFGTPPTNCNNIEKFTNNKVVVTNDIDSLYAANVMVISDFNYSGGPDEISVEEFVNRIQNHFGKNYIVNLDVIKESKGPSRRMQSYEWNEDAQKFVKVSNNWGGTCGPWTEYEIINVVEEEKQLEIYIKVAFIKRKEEHEMTVFLQYYTDYERIHLFHEYKTYDEYMENHKMFGEKIKEMGGNYKFTFNKEGENWVFVSSEPIE